MKPPPLSLEEAQERLLAMAQPLEVEERAVTDACGSYLAEPLLARRTQPADDLSAMDGYAMLPGDIAGPWQVIGESAAGHPFGGRLAQRQAVRISTGALMPVGAEVVILQEDITRESDGDVIRLTGEAPSPPGKHIRRTGMDFRLGDCLLESGTRIGPAQLALAIAAGHARITVRRRPRLAIVDSGDELTLPGEPEAPGRIPASNGPMLAALAAPYCSELLRLGPVADSLDALAQAFAAAESADVVVTSGGASVGDHDLIRPALEAWGAEIDFWRVAIKPGKPILVARRGRQLILGLPGNPAASHVTAFLFLLPLLRALQGAALPLPRDITSNLAVPMRAGGSRREFLRARWNGTTIEPLALQDSGALSSLATANALIDRAANAPEGLAGEEVRAFLIENGGIA